MKKPKIGVQPRKSAARKNLPPVTRRLLGVSRGVQVDRTDYLVYLEQKYR